MKIRRDGPVNVVTQIKEALKSRIFEGEFGQDEKLPSERTFSIKYEVSRLSVRHAITLLEKEGYLYRIPYRGTYITKRDNLEIKTIGLLVGPLLKISFFSAILSGIEKAISAEGNRLLLRCANEDPALERKCIKELTEDSVAGLIIISGVCSSANMDVLKQVSHRIPIAVADIYLGAVESDYVTSDDETGGYEATRHLIDMGHNHILHLAGPAEHSTGVLRLKGYKKALEEKGIDFSEDMVRYTNWETESGYYETKKFLMTKRDRITGIFACNDKVAVGAYRAIKELGMKIPENISIVGYGNLDIGYLLESPLTTVEQHPEKIGEKVYGLLMERLEGKRDFHDIRKIIVDTELVIRESCGIKKTVIKV